MSPQGDPKSANESSSLLIAPSDSTAMDEQSYNEHRSPHAGHATFIENVLNQAKTCMGTGTLALPFAARQGGLVLHFFGLLGIAGWNIYSTDRLLRSHVLLPNNSSRPPPPEGTSELGKVAFYAMGKRGLVMLDIALTFLLSGIIVAYIDAIVSFLGSTPVTIGSPKLDALLVAVIVAVLSNVPDLGYLAKLSAMGLSILLLTFVIIATYGDYSGFSLNWWPKNGMSGVSRWFGCNVFGFGTVPFTYNLRDSMEEPHRMLASHSVAMLFVAGSYIILGSGMLLIYPDVDGDILQELPTSGLLPTAVRLAMTVVVLATAPLIVVPCGELFEGILFHEEEASPGVRVGVRLSICVLCATISLGVPAFVDVLSFVGCCCVAVVSFIVPPLLHIFLTSGESTNDLPVKNSDTADASRPSLLDFNRIFWVDVAMLCWGVVATVISTTFTFQMEHQA